MKFTSLLGIYNYLLAAWLHVRRPGKTWTFWVWLPEVSTFLICLLTSRIFTELRIPHTADFNVNFDTLLNIFLINPTQCHNSVMKFYVLFNINLGEIYCSSMLNSIFNIFS